MAGGEPYGEIVSFYIHSPNTALIQAKGLLGFKHILDFESSCWLFRKDTLDTLPIQTFDMARIGL
ncbi:MAG: hypothetical protein DUD39_08340 [Coriobacteriaceae bacterium]|nr:MAG: hypothetical protein DUD39_08340 [Coriobacteriaceae bacterium]